MRIFAFNTVRAPYRVDLYNLLGQKAELTAFFEQEHDPVRNPEWYATDYRGFTMKHARKWHKSLRYPKLDVLTAVKKKDTDLVYMSEWSSITALLLIAKCIVGRIPYVISMDGYLEDPGKRKSTLKEVIKRTIARYALATIGTGESTAHYARSIGFSEDRVFTVGFTTVKDAEIMLQPIGQEDKSVLKEKLGLDPNASYVISVGQLVDRKGYDLLIQSWAQLGVRKHWKLLIIGDGEKRDELLDRIEKTGLNNINVLSGMDKAMLFQYYKCAEFFVLSTREDVWGLVINEAMASALPVLTTQQCVAGVELVEDGINGHLYDCDDVAQCAAYMQLLMENPGLRVQMGQNNLRKMKDFTVEREADRIFEILSNLLSTKE